MPFNGGDILWFFAYPMKNNGQIDDVFDLRNEMLLTALIGLRFK